MEPIDDMPETPASRFTLLNAADVDPMTEYRRAAEAMPIGGCYDLPTAEVMKMTRAIIKAYGPRTTSVKRLGAGQWRVTRCEQRPAKERKPRAKAKTGRKGKVDAGN